MDVPSANFKALQCSSATSPPGVLGASAAPVAFAMFALSLFACAPAADDTESSASSKQTQTSQICPDSNDWTTHYCGELCLHRWKEPQQYDGGESLCRTGAGSQARYLGCKLDPQSTIEKPLVFSVGNLVSGVPSSNHYVRVCGGTDIPTSNPTPSRQNEHP